MHHKLRTTSFLKTPKQSRRLSIFGTSPASLLSFLAFINSDHKDDKRSLVLNRVVITAGVLGKSRHQGSAGGLRITVITCWLTWQCDGPWLMRMRTMSTSPRHAARCSGKQPLLSATFVKASNWSSFSTTSLKQTNTNTDGSIKIWQNWG